MALTRSAGTSRALKQFPYVLALPRGAQPIDQAARARAHLGKALYVAQRRERPRQGLGQGIRVAQIIGRIGFAQGLCAEKLVVGDRYYKARQTEATSFPCSPARRA